MKRKRHAGARRLAAILGLALLFIAGAAAAVQVYKWTDTKGVVHYGDAPPPGSGASLLRTGAQASPTAILPYELARAVQLHPVLLYTTARCDACDQGRALLRERGIPFQERTVNTGEDEARLRQLSGTSELPLLMVGNRKLMGFSATSWHEALSAAAYPRSSILPPGYQAAAPLPAAPAAPAGAVRAELKMPPDEAAAQAGEQQPRQPSGPARQLPQKQPAAGSAPPDFQF